MASKHPNVYMDVSAWPPNWWEPSLVRNIDGARCRTKTMWGTNGGIQRALEYFDEMDKLPIRDESKRLILRENAMMVYNLLALAQNRGSLFQKLEAASFFCCL